MISPQENRLILDVVEQLQKYENAQCVIVTSDTNGPAKSERHLLEEHFTDAGIAIIHLIAFSGPRVTQTLIQSGKLCPYHILIFGRKQKAAEFLNTHESDLRC